MENADKIIRHPKYLSYMKMNEEEEQTRKFCHHDLRHALDVARVAYIIALECRYDIKKETIYSAALLHDIARWKQYRDGVDHACEGAILAEEILKEIGLDADETEIITDAIKTHRNKGEKSSILGELLYKGDKACRVCGACDAISECNWFTDGQRPELKY